MSKPTHLDQAEDLRKQVLQVEEEVSANEISSLPPRREVHKKKQTKQTKIKIKFPIVRLLLILFFLVVILAATSQYWIDRFSF
ncbi:hypothetical protein [Bacillus sp. FJAT-45350]|uniref:hypothetical protein n=1 Tax=Bacillus sp. FJAT-45350 TaxID=2011014 RepID=UPI000BB7F7AB|nr:hypothetical protein [Bacillus sp. FJAT-45350]